MSVYGAGARRDTALLKGHFLIMANGNVIINERAQTQLRTADFFYDLPQELIAQHPMEKRDTSRLLVINRDGSPLQHKHFFDIKDYLHPKDVLVINESRVIPARIFGHLEDRPEATVELLLLRQHAADTWECLVKPGKRARIGQKQIFGGILHGEVIDMVEEGNRIIKFDYNRKKYGNVYNILHEIGLMPLPPYITERLDEPERYQTIYARHNGSAAAPTAGLHFTPELMDEIRSMGVAIAPVTLHVGLGTFRPVKEDSITDHVMHTEFFSVSEESAELINSRRAAGGRVICVGTTSCRTIESASDDSGKVHAMSADTGIFIYPGYKFKATDALITNFHLPESTLLMLVSAFYNREKMLEAYRTAVEEKYRFFSFGDAMLIE